jgi:DNA-binding response OmpR family regulator
MKILLVEDDKTIIAALTHSLAVYHHIVDAVTDGEAGWTYATTFEYDLIVLDVCLPKLDGISFCRRFREEGYTVPVLFLTAQGNSIDKVRGLDAGADDYVVKPFDIDELSARIRALLRRGSDRPFPHLVWGDLILNPSTCEVTYSDRPLTLTTKEYDLLELFLRDGHCIYSTDEILDRLWSSEDFPVEATVRSHLRRLRQKLNAAGAPHDFIATLHGRGYHLKSEEALNQNAGITSFTNLIHNTSAIEVCQTPTEVSPLLLIVAQDPTITQAIVAAAACAGIRTTIAETVSQVSDWLEIDLNKTRQLDAILFKLPSNQPISKKHPPFDLEILQMLAHSYPDLPILVMGNFLELSNRLEVLKQGGKVLIESSVTAEAAIAAVRECLSMPRRGTKVMVVDDDQTLLHTLPTLLQPWGFKVSTLAAPQQFWNVLEAVEPDALVLDVKMPEMNGLELCQILRSDLRWRHLPILFLSAVSDAQIQHKAFEVGADDYLCKPVAGADLAHRILNRLQRHKAWLG